ncbi:MoaF-related domain-containing protein [Ralstonia syzygii]|uniref:MoaF-related domain-containing protein n=1 Tax=Ralstonia solanacearum species complex TaxID=3116862 RepID=UPI003907FA4E
MLYWHEPHTGMNVVHVEDLERGIAHTNIAVPDGSAQHLTDTLRILGDARWRPCTTSSTRCAAGATAPCHWWKRPARYRA